mgnify:CR=1 FL=1
MTDLELAKEGLAGHTICLCKDGQCLTSDRRGIATMMDWIAEGIDLTGYSAADIVVGKAAAMLFVKSKIAAVYARTISQSAKVYLEAHHIPLSYGTLTERIINREGTDICPMEKTVLATDDVAEGYRLLKERFAAMKRG